MISEAEYQSKRAKSLEMKEANEIQNRHVSAEA